jgi:hypothetical protein
MKVKKFKDLNEQINFIWFYYNPFLSFWFEYLQIERCLHSFSKERRNEFHLLNIYEFMIHLS